MPLLAQYVLAVLQGSREVFGEMQVHLSIAEGPLTVTLSNLVPRACELFVFDLSRPFQQQQQLSSG